MNEALKNLPKYWQVTTINFKTYVRAELWQEPPTKNLQELRAWGLKYGLNLKAHSSTSYFTRSIDAEIWNMFEVSEGATTETEKIQENDELVICRACYRIGLKTAKVQRIGSSGILNLCARCIISCAACKNLLSRQEVASYKRNLCNDCAPTFKCYGCGKLREKADGQEIILHNSSGRPLTAKNTLYCSECVNNKCSECNKVFHRNVKLRDGLCPSCIEERMLKDFERHEKFRLEELPKGGLTVASLPSRPFRTVSIETEVDGDRRVFAQTLYKSGIVRVPEVESYGTRTPDDSSWPAFLKHDGSVTGGELISFMLELNKKQHAEALKTTLRKLRALEMCKIIEFNPNCGGHIHIDATGFSQANVWRLLTIWNYVEDFTFRLAGSGHKYGHRTLVPGHDRANHGRGYSHPTVKGPWGLKSTAARAFGGQDRMCGLNFQPYLGAIRNCGCHAYDKDDWTKCKCNLPKCTIEWRVWNSQRNPRILHAWIAYMQAMHALADDAEPDVNWERNHEPLGWTKQPYDKTSDSHRKLLRDRIEWIFSNFILTENERDSLVYAIKNSDIPVTREDERQWLSIKGPSETYPVRKAPRAMPSAPRNRTITCTIPDPNKPIKTQKITEQVIRAAFINQVGRW